MKTRGKFEMIKIKNNRVIIEQTEKQIKRLLAEGIIFEIRTGEFKFLDKEENIFIESQGGLKENE